MVLPPDIADPDAARAFCADLAGKAARLLALIERESGMIAASALGGLEPLHAEKAELSALYLADMARLKRNAEVVRALAPEAADDLRPVLQELGARLVANQNALAAVLSVTERLIRSAALKALAMEGGPGAYGADAKIAEPPPFLPAGTMSRRA
jgi:hypothetical protein